MSTAVKKLLMVFLVLLLVSSVCILIHGNYITFRYKVTDPDFKAEDIKVTFEQEGIVKVRDVSLKNGVAKIEIEKIATGGTKADIALSDAIHIEQINTDGLLMYSPGRLVFPCWQLILFAGFAFCLAAAIIFFLEYRKMSAAELFSYIPVYLLGLVIFFSVLAAGTGILSILLLADPASFSLSNLLVWAQSIMVYFTILTAPIIVAFAVALCISNVELIRKEGFKKVNLLGIVLAFLMIVGLAFGFIVFRLMNSTRASGIDIAFVNSYYAVFSFFVSLLIAVFVIFFRVSRHTPSYDKDYIVILGCRVKADGTLYPLVRGRVDRAIAFAKAQQEAGGPAPLFVPSGGKGVNEPVSEGEAMANYLVAQGIPKERVAPETESKNTKENMRFSKKIADEIHPGGKGIFSTTNYHVFRSGIIAKKEGIELDGIGAKTKWYFWPNALIREFIGLLVDDIREVVLFTVLIIAVSVLTTILL
ncbi:MAG: YdcF family protein [Clostridia bacterium]|nr:YdcF family protein [Clostridia bacterium]